ncbi:MAG: glycosyltransferase [Clostridia bacterium]|nr:glycosyltransferase [Clostridia bacterium]
MEWLHIVNCVLAALFCIFYAYQFFYILYGLVVKPKSYPKTDQTNRYAVLIPARNESVVIGQLIDSLKAQDYPSELVDVYVAADNCTDNTAAVAEQHGAVVYERFDKEHKGKGYTMSFLFNKLFELKGKDYYDGYFVFDADNLLNPDFITQMDRCFCDGNRVVTSHRNSKNYGTNWITAG